MKLSIQNRKVGEITILDLGGRIILGEECDAIRAEVQQLLNTNKNILLNFADITYVDSSGVGTLVLLHSTAREQGGHLKLLNVDKKFKETLQITRLVTVFESFDNEKEAVASFE